MAKKYTFYPIRCHHPLIISPYFTLNNDFEICIYLFIKNNEYISLATCFCNADLPAYNLNWGPEGCESDGIKTRRLYESKQIYDVPKHVYKFMKNVKSK